MTPEVPGEQPESVPDQPQRGAPLDPGRGRHAVVATDGGPAPGQSPAQHRRSRRPPGLPKDLIA